MAGRPVPVLVPAWRRPGRRNPAWHRRRVPAAHRRHLLLEEHRGPRVHRRPRRRLVRHLLRRRLVRLRLRLRRRRARVGRHRRPRHLRRVPARCRRPRHRRAARRFRHHLRRQVLVPLRRQAPVGRLRHRRVSVRRRPRLGLGLVRHHPGRALRRSVSVRHLGRPVMVRRLRRHPGSALRPRGRVACRPVSVRRHPGRLDLARHLRPPGSARLRRRLPVAGRRGRPPLRRSCRRSRRRPRCRRR